jgi:recombinational DNA repair protein (RecF pathway)
MFYATARSVREERSKQRYALQDFSNIRVSLVRGKGGWKIGSVESSGNFFTLAGSRKKRTAVTTIIKLVRQFVHGEESHPFIFSDLKNGLLELTKTKDEQLQNIVDIFTLRFLSKLGYIAGESSHKEFFESEKWYELKDLPKSVYTAIDKAKKESHL